MRNGFMLFNDHYACIRTLSAEQKGMLLDALFTYSITGKVPEDMDGTIMMAFNFMSKAMDVAFDKYEQAQAERAERDEEISRKRAEAGRKGMEKRWGDKQAKQANQAKTTPKQPQNNPTENYNKNNKTITKITNDNKNNTNNKINIKYNNIAHSNTNVLSCVNNTHAGTQENTLQTCGDFARDLLQDDIFTERVAMQFHTTPEDVLILVNTFNNEQSIKQTAHADYNDYRRHAYDWIRIQIEKQEKERKHGNPIDNIRQAQERQLARLNKIAARDREVYEPLPNPF